MPAYTGTLLKSHLGSLGSAETDLSVGGPYVNGSTLSVMSMAALFQ